jgi:hypothetical protein
VVRVIEGMMGRGDNRAVRIIVSPHNLTRWKRPGASCDAYGKPYTPPPGKVDPSIDMKTPVR